MVETNPNFAEEFGQTFDNPDVPHADAEFDPDCFDSYLGMELALDHGPSGEAQFARFTKRLKSADGTPIGIAHANPILDTRLYEVKYHNGHWAALEANTIAQNLFVQVDQDGHRLLWFDEIIGHWNNGSQIQEGEGEDCTLSSNGVKQQVETTRGWEINLKWKDGSTTWNAMKDVKDSFPVQLAEYAIKNG